MRYTHEEMQRATRTCRTHGAIGARALVPQIVLQYADKKDTILDYGSGKHAVHAKSLGTRGYNITAHDFGDNFVKGTHNPNALKHKYDMVYASNVMNVQTSQKMLDKTLDEIYRVLKPGGTFLCNYPQSPRYVELDDDTVLSTYGMEAVLKAKFKSVKRIKASSPVWICHK
jgi:SAM-dependent methyltransferase